MSLWRCAYLVKYRDTFTFGARSNVVVKTLATSRKVAGLRPNEVE
jgi:hypothetical protein